MPKKLTLGGVLALALGAFLYLGPPPWPDDVTAILRVISGTTVVSVILATACSKWRWCYRFKEKPGTRKMSVLLAFIIGGGIGVAVWLLIPESKPSKPALLAVNREQDAVPTPQSVSYRNAVTEIVQAIEPKALVTVGGAFMGPDGARAVDMQIASMRDGKARRIAIDVIERSDGKPVSIDAVDNADSKRRDLGVDDMFISSNTGFDEVALSKAKRVGVGLIAAINRGDHRIKAVIEEQIFLRTIELLDYKITYIGADMADKAKLDKADNATVRYGNLPMSLWIENRRFKLIKANALKNFFLITPRKDTGLVASYDFVEPIVLTSDVGDIRIRGLRFTIFYKIDWLVQTVRLDAKASIYDYARGDFLRKSGWNELFISGINYAKAIAIAPPNPLPSMGIGLHAAGTDWAFVRLVNANPMTFTQEMEKDSGALEARIRPEDLPLNVPDVDLTSDSASAPGAR